MSIPESRPDYRKLAEDALSDVAADDGMWNAEDMYEIARALQSCAADLAAAEQERDEAVERLQSHIDVYIDADNRAEAAEAERDRLAAALEHILTLEAREEVDVNGEYTTTQDIGAWRFKDKVDRIAREALNPGDGE